MNIHTTGIVIKNNVIVLSKGTNNLQIKTSLLCNTSQCAKLFQLTFHKVVFMPCLKTTQYYNLKCLSSVTLQANWQLDDYFQKNSTAFSYRQTHRKRPGYQTETANSNETPFGSARSQNLDALYVRNALSSPSAFQPL